MEYINEEDVRNVMEKIDTANKVLFDTLKKNGVTEEQFESLMSQALKSMFAGDYSMVKMFEDVKKQEETE